MRLDDPVAASLELCEDVTMRENRQVGEPLHFATLWEAIADEIPAAPASIRHEVPGIRLLVEVGGDAGGVRRPGACGYSELIASSEPAPRVRRSEQDIFLSYTGGTTGLPKGVRYTIGRGVTNSLRLRDLFLGLFVAEVPRAPNGKIDYAAVRAVLADGQCQPPRPPGLPG
jgi:acyl-coenzyme A synthetase/AMP-(fatty) acid ligase